MNETGPPRPSLPAIQKLALTPSSLALEDGRDERRVLVWGITDAGEQIDLTSEATFQTDSPAIQVSDGYVRPKAKGAGEVSICAAGKQTKLPVTVKSADMPEVRFVRDVMPVLSRVGCNAGTCHGSAKGKNGFKLSLRGYDPETDYHALIDDLSGRRFNRVRVEESLMLLKPSAAVPHEGGQVFKPSSREYEMLRTWIAQGSRPEETGSARATRIEILPPELNLALPGMQQQLIVQASYPDGSMRDVTRDAVITSNNEEIAKVKDSQVTSVRRGEAAVLVRYEGNYATAELRVMGDRAGYSWSPVPEHNFIDRAVNAKLQKMKILPSGLCSDAEFIRRASLDLTGVPPTGERVRAFLADGAESKVKRERLVDELIGSPEYTRFWANKWADLLQCNSENLGQKGVWAFKDWIRQEIAANRPYDQFVREILLAEGSSYLNPPVNYFRVLREPGKAAEDISQTFLGVRFNCNKCHDHPFERWTQSQYYQFSAYFARLAFKRGTLGKDVVRTFTGDNQTVTGEEVVYLRDEGEVKHPKTDKDVPPHVPYGVAKAAPPDQDRREPFVEWLTSKDNPYFALSMANRVWSYFFGRGIIDPVDDIRGSNPPSNGPLLDALTKEFVNSGFDVRQLMRTICQSRTYQASIVPNQWNTDDHINFSHALPRRLSAEQLLDAVAVSTGTKPTFAGLPKGLRSVDLPDGIVEGNDFLSLFGRPKRQSACECERTSNLTLAHAMNLINGKMISDAVQSPDNQLRKLVEATADNGSLVQDIYLAVLNRPATEKELAAIDFSGSSRLETAQDLAWALMNSPAFLFNR
ncbi:MAG: DUF1549 and DUF1553 domain-containing protein [Verrucomicrobiota bacterium]